MRHFKNGPGVLPVKLDALWSERWLRDSRGVSCNRAGMWMVSLKSTIQPATLTMAMTALDVTAVDIESDFCDLPTCRR